MLMRSLVVFQTWLPTNKAHSLVNRLPPRQIFKGAFYSMLRKALVGDLQTLELSFAIRTLLLDFVTPNILGLQLGSARTSKSFIVLSCLSITNSLFFNFNGQAVLGIYCLDND